jgi:hypothetical protein
MNPGEVATSTTTFANEDRRWLADLTALNSTAPGTVDGDAFDAATFPDGRVPSGTVVARNVAGHLVKYAGSGLDAVGHLLDTITVRAGALIPVAVVETGAVIRNRLAVNSGLDAAAETALASIRYRNI